MSWDRGLFRFWIIAAVIWVVIAGWLFWSGCYFFPDSPFNPICDTGEFRQGIPVAGLLRQFSAWDWVRWIWFAAWPPLALLTLGYAARWALQGFGRRNSN